mgnify:CR=1 FL=1
MSQKSLIIVESPSKARTIEQYLDGEFEVVACVGHVKDLPSSKLGIDIENNFEMTLDVLPNRKDLIKELIKKIKSDNTPVSNGDLEVNNLISKVISKMTPKIPIIS